jgi:Galactose oxidase-like, Early set domain/Kelch motif
MKTKVIVSIAAVVGLLMLLTLASRSAVSAQATFPDPNAACPRAQCGELSPLIPMQSTEAVHMGLVWKRSSPNPKILYHARFPEYAPNDIADPALVDLAIARGAFTTAGRQFDASLRDVLHGFDPFLGLGTDRTADDSFQRLTYGGYRLRQGLSQSVPTRIVANRMMERQLLFDISHPDAFKNSGKLHTSLLDESDFAMNRAAFSENGYSRGMFYNTYCNARVTLADGRVYVFGGHDMQSNNGLYKVNIFDPETESWIRRREPCTTSNWRSDPFGLALFGRDPDAQFYDNCDPRDQQSTQPSEPSDQKYARWYPSAIPLPNGWVLVVGGFDQNNAIGPDPDRAAKGQQNIVQNDAAFNASRVNQVVPEVYDPATDRNIALENARMAFPLYPQLEVVQTGPGRNDWKVCTFNGEIDFGAEPVPGGARFGVGGGSPDFENGNTWCLDVLAAMKDPSRNTPAKNHWTLVDTAQEVRPYCCPTATLLEIDSNGLTVSHKWIMFSGEDATGAPTATIEAIDFAEPVPRWRSAGQLAYALTTRKAVVLPDGKVLLGHGLNRGLASVGNAVLDFERREGLRFHMYNPASGGLTPLARTTVSRGLHGTATLLPDGTVFFAGENREALVQANDPSFPLTTSYAGVLPSGDPDQAVPVGQIFSPPYLFSQNGTAAARPVITEAPAEISYGGPFDITVAGSIDEIASVAILRSDHNTHSLTAGDRYVKLAFHQKGAERKDELRVVTPKLPAQATPGIYMLYVVDRNGVPSVGKKIVLLKDTTGSSVDFR